MTGFRAACGVRRHSDFQLTLAERALLSEHNRFLAKINYQAKACRATKSKEIGTARVMSYEDLEKARAERAAKETEKEIRGEATKAPKAKRTGKGLVTEPTAKEADVGKGQRSRKRESNAELETAEPKAKKAYMSEVEAVDAGIATRSWQALAAEMWYWNR